MYIHRISWTYAPHQVSLNVYVKRSRCMSNGNVVR